MTNKNKYLEDLSKKLSAEKFRDELNKVANMVKSKEVQKHFNDEEKEYGKNFYNFSQQTRDDIFEQNLPPKYNKNSLTF